MNNQKTNELYQMWRSDQSVQMAAQLAQKLSKCICPLYRDLGHDSVEYVGSCVLLQVGEHFFAATAAHNLEEIGLGLMIPGKERLIRCRIIFHVTHLATSKHKDKDIYDFAIGRISPELKTDMHSFDFWDVKQTDIGDVTGLFYNYMFMGFPASKNKPNFRTKVVEPRVYTFANPSAHTHIYKKYRYNQKTHILIHYDKKQSVDLNGNRTQFPDPVGMSGGAAWAIVTIEYPNLIGFRHVAKLAGIINDRSRDHRFWIATRINLVLELLRKIEPSLYTQIPIARGKIFVPSADILIDN